MYFYAHDRDQEQWNGPFSTRAEAIAAATAEGHSFFLDTAHQPDALDMVPSADDIIEDIGEYAVDTHGECAEDFPDVSDEAKAELAALLEAWSYKHLRVRFWICNGDVEQVDA